MAAALLSGCGGGHGAHTAGGTARPQSPVTSSVGTPTTRTVTRPVAYWPYEKLVGQLAGRSLALAHGVVRLRSDLLECNGDGTPVKTGTTRRWSHYTCTQTLFQNGADRDVTFDVTILSTNQLSIGAARYGPQ